MNMEIEGLNPELYDMVERGQLSGKKIAELIRLCGIVDRFANTRFASEEEVTRLKEKFGEEPDIITWGDYFQTEIGSRYFDLADEEFTRIIDTVRFDLISSALIFTGKKGDFLEMVDSNYNRLADKDPASWTEKEQEDAHLYILKQYFLDMNLSEKTIQENDREWFESFIKMASRAVG